MDHELVPRRTTDEIYAANPDARAAGVLAPDGTARRVPGGYQVTGQWNYASGIWHADWAGVGVLVEDEAGQVVDQGFALVPAADYTVDDVWHVAGMRASGSNSVIVRDVFVPEHRVLTSARLLFGDYLADHPDEPLYRSAVFSVLVAVLIGPQLGLGRAALDLVTAKAGRKGIAYTAFGKQSDSVAFQLQVAEAATLIDTAHLHGYRAADDIDRFAARGEYPDVRTRARIRADAAVALRSVNTAVNTLVFAHGAGSFAEVNPLQRIWRDSNVGARHAVMLPQVNLEVYGKALLGVEEQITFLI
ncbi:acyl-CoA dehydrogenase family protein [Actinokineospora sp. G85]|uniref:acyl-CoA dehydrogenase family protein n=1 Tax=Actinokineospora sp. G85 TaxID=3406626 RepID=UPI003C73CB05